VRKTREVAPVVRVKSPQAACGDPLGSASPKLPLLARARRLRMQEVRSWDYVNDLQAIMAEWIAQNPP